MKPYKSSFSYLCLFYCLLFAGILSFYGDMGNSNSEITAMGRYNSGFGLTVLKRFGEAYGASLNIVKGNIIEEPSLVDHLKEQDPELGEKAERFHAAIGLIKSYQRYLYLFPGKSEVRSS